MCTTIYFEDRGEYMQTQGELAEALGGPDRIEFFDFGDRKSVMFEAESCMCCVDVGHLNNGYQCVSGWEEYACDYIARPAHTQEPRA
jgi:hypothetical protein